MPVLSLCSSSTRLGAVGFLLHQQSCLLNVEARGLRGKSGQVLEKRDSVDDAWETAALITEAFVAGRTDWKALKTDLALHKDCPSDEDVFLWMMKKGLLRGAFSYKSENLDDAVFPNEGGHEADLLRAYLRGKDDSHSGLPITLHEQPVLTFKIDEHTNIENLEDLQKLRETSGICKTLNDLKTWLGESESREKKKLDQLEKPEKKEQDAMKFFTKVETFYENRTCDSSTKAWLNSLVKDSQKKIRERHNERIGEVKEAARREAHEKAHEKDRELSKVAQHVSCTYVGPKGPSASDSSSPDGTEDENEKTRPHFIVKCKATCPKAKTWETKYAFEDQKLIAKDLQHNSQQELCVGLVAKRRAALVQKRRTLEMQMEKLFTAAKPAKASTEDPFFFANSDGTKGFLWKTDDDKLAIMKDAVEATIFHSSIGALDGALEAKIGDTAALDKFRACASVCGNKFELRHSAFPGTGEILLKKLYVNRTKVGTGSFTFEMHYDRNVNEDKPSQPDVRAHLVKDAADLIADWEWLPFLGAAAAAVEKPGQMVRGSVSEVVAAAVVEEPAQVVRRSNSAPAQCRS